MSDDSAADHPAVVADRLLAEADRVLGADSANRNRIACWLARSAFEAVVDGILRDHGLEPGESSMRSRLSCLTVAFADQPNLIATADYTWARLSHACHHHAYQLDPSIIETRHLIGNIHEVASVVAGGPGAR